MPTYPSLLRFSAICTLLFGCSEPSGESREDGAAPSDHERIDAAVVRPDPSPGSDMDGEAEASDVEAPPMDTGSASDGGTSADSGGYIDLRAEQHSGSRIKARFYVNAAGAREFVGWFDSMRNASCTLERAADGVVRCLPATASATQYFDPACQQPVGGVAAGRCEDITALSTIDVSACPARRVLYERGPQLFYDGGLPPYYRLSDSACTGPVWGDPLSKVYARGAELSAGDYVGYTESPQDIGNGYRVIRYMGEDGSLAFGRIEDIEQDFVCEFNQTTDGVLRCLPRTRSMLSGEFIDPACSRPAAFDPQPACQFRHALERVTTPCQTRMRVFGVGAAADTAYRSQPDGGCSAITPTGVTHAVSAELPATSFKAPVIVDGPLLGGLRQKQLELAPGVRMGMEWHDIRDNSRCAFATAADGQLRCLPLAESTAGIGDYFIDAACTQRVATFGGSCTTPTVAARVVAGMCPQRRHLFPITGLHSGPLYSNAFGTCNMIGISSLSAWTYGPEIDPSNFALVETTEL